jgi:transposase InsO family protein
MQYTSKQLQDLLNISHVALVGGLKDVIYTLKDVDGSTKKVKHYKYEDLPQRYKDKLPQAPQKEEQKEESTSTNISTANFTKKYLLAKPHKQKEAVLRVRLIEFYLKKDTSINVRSWLKSTLENDIEFDVLGDVSVKQLFDWRTKYLEVKAKGENIVEAFVDARGRGKNTFVSMSKEIQETAIAYFLRSSKINMMNIYKNIAFMFGEHMCSYDTLLKFYKDWVRKNPVEALFAKNPDACKNKYMWALGDMSEKATYRNSYWELDSTPADIMCSDGKRYNIIGAIDVYSRRLILIVEPSSDKYAIARLLRKGILTLGIPENVIIDNGKDYQSTHFESICTNLGIEMHTVPPFSGDKKPHIERVFGTMSRTLFEDLPCYVGANVSEKMAIKNKLSFADKLKSIDKWREERRAKSDEEKKAFENLFRIKKENVGVDIAMALSRDELQLWLDNWIAKEYEQNRHGGLDMKPIEKWNDSTLPVQSIGDERMLDLLLGASKLKVVGKKGIRDEKCEYYHPELQEYMGKTVKIMESDDLGTIIVYDPIDMRFICEAYDPAHTGTKREDAVKAQKEQKKKWKALDKAISGIKDLDLPDVRDRIEATKEIIAANTIAVTKATDVTKMLFGASKEIQKQEFREAIKANKKEIEEKREEFRNSGVRPKFQSVYDRFVWAIVNDQWNDKDEKLKQNVNNKIFDLAYKEAMRQKVG